MISIPFFFAEDVSSENIILDEESSKHAVQVLRMREGERIRLTDGKGNLVEGAIESAHRKHCTITKISGEHISRPQPALTIAISLTKNTGRFEWFLEKATELGTAAIVPLICERTEKQHARYDRLVSICKSAMLQSSQAWMPSLHQPISFKEVLSGLSAEQKLFGHISPETKKLSAALDRSLDSHVILIGPEGDFSEEEISLAKYSGFEGVSFGKTILRVETAGVYAAVVHSAGQIN